MANKRESRVYYRSSSDGVVVVKDGTELAVYNSTEALIETHIKGMLAKDLQDTRKIRDGLQSYRPSDVTGRE